MIAAGTMNRRVALQSATRAADAAGQMVPTWTTVATVWAEIETTAGSERMAIAQQVATCSHRVRIRYRADVTAGWRLMYGSRILDINAAIDEGERHESLLLLCMEKAAV